MQLYDAIRRATEGEPAKVILHVAALIRVAAGMCGRRPVSLGSLPPKIVTQFSFWSRQASKTVPAITAALMVSNGLHPRDRPLIPKKTNNLETIGGGVG